MGKLEYYTLIIILGLIYMEVAASTGTQIVALFFSALGVIGWYIAIHKGE